MADAFRGLTIRLGADVRPLASAIGSVRKAAGSAQSELNRLSKALKFNPGDAKAMAGRIGLMEDKMRLAARSTQLMKAAMKQADAETRKAASSTKDVFANAQRIRNEYNGVNGQLESLYDAMARVRAASKRITFEEARKDVRKLASALDSVDAAEQRLARKTLRGYATSLANRGELPLGIGGKGVAGANNALGALDRLRASQKTLNVELAKANKVEGFKKIQTQAVEARAELEHLASEHARFRSELASSGSGNTALNRTTREISRMDGVLASSRSRFESMSEAYQKMPGSMEAAAGKAIAMNTHVENLNSAVNTLKDRMQAIENTKGFDRQRAAAANVYENVSRAERQYAKLEVQLKETQGKAELLRQSMRNLDDVSNGAYKRSSRWKEDERQLKEYEAEIKKLTGKIREADSALKMANMEKEWAEAADGVVRYTAEVKKAKAIQSRLKTFLGMGEGLKTFGYVMSGSITAGLTRAGRYMVDSVDEVDSSYRDMRKTVQGTEEEFEQLKDAALDYGRTHVTSADQILSIEAIGGQLGIQARNLEAFATTVSNLDIATDMNTEDIAADLGKMGSVMGLSADQYANFADSLVRLGNSEPAFESDIMKIATRFMGMGKVVGMSADQMLGWATAATATGQKSEAAGSSMQRFISNVENAVVKGGEKLDSFAKLAGVSSDEFKAMFQDDASDAMYKVIEGLGKMQQSGESVNQMLGELGIGNVRDKQLLEGLAQQMANATDENNVLRDSLQMSENAWNGISDKWGDAGDAAREAEKKSQGFSGQLQIMKNNAQALAVEMGDGLAPMLELANELITNVTGAISGLPQEAKTAIVTIAGLAAAFGPVATVVGGAMQTLDVLGTRMSTFPRLYKKMAGNIDLAATQIAMSMGRVEKSGKMPAKALNGVAKGLSGVMKAAAGAGIAAGVTVAVWGIGQLIESYAKAKERSDRFAESASKSANLFSTLRRSAEEAAPQIKSVADQLEYAKDCADAAAQSNIDMADSLSKSLSKYTVDADSLDQATDVIMSIGKKAADGAKLSKNQVDELREAIVSFNSINGTSYVVDETGAIRNEEGELVNLADAFYKVAEAKKAAWLADAMGDAYNSSMNNVTETKRAIEENQAAADEWSRKAREAQANGNWVDAERYASEAKKLGDVIDTQKAQLDIAEEAAEYTKAARDIAQSAADSADSIAGVIARYDEFADALHTHGLTAKDFEGSLKALGIGFDDLSGLSAEAVKKIEEGWTGSMESLGQVLEDNGVKLDDGARKMLDLATNAGVSGQELSAIWSKTGGDIDQITSSLEIIDALKIGNKSFTVDDDGTITVAEGELGDLDYIKIGDKAFKVNDNGTVSTTATEIDGLKGKIGSIPASKSVTVKADTSSADSTINSFLARMGASFAKTYYLKVKETVSKGATGTFTDFPITRAVPAHAAGGMTGIVTQPTMTNWGLVGEAGAEALVRWAHGTAVVPLQNHRYVRPFAQTIASEMGAAAQQPVNVTNVYLNDVLVNSHPAMVAATEEYLGTIARYTAMGGR